MRGYLNAGAIAVSVAASNALVARAGQAISTFTIPPTANAAEAIRAAVAFWAVTGRQTDRQTLS